MLFTADLKLVLPRDPEPKDKNSYKLDFYLKLWNQIWDNCANKLFLQIKGNATAKFGENAKSIFCSAMAYIYIGVSANIHSPLELLGLNITDYEVMSVLKNLNPSQDDVWECVEIVFETH